MTTDRLQLQTCGVEVEEQSACVRVSRDLLDAFYRAETLFDATGETRVAVETGEMKPKPAGQEMGIAPPQPNEGHGSTSRTI